MADPSEDRRDLRAARRGRRGAGGVLAGSSDPQRARRKDQEREAKERFPRGTPGASRFRPGLVKEKAHSFMAGGGTPRPRDLRPPRPRALRTSSGRCRSEIRPSTPDLLRFTRLSATLLPRVPSRLQNDREGERKEVTSMVKVLICRS